MQFGPPWSKQNCQQSVSVNVQQPARKRGAGVKPLNQAGAGATGFADTPGAAAALAALPALAAAAGATQQSRARRRQQNSAFLFMARPLGEGSAATRSILTLKSAERVKNGAVAGPTPASPPRSFRCRSPGAP